ncbi:hypothetical protein R3X28_07140 [Maribacter sp. TH_r10]|uniref:Uncharacterized protein n=1 Tax=Maribacter luteus TaxID=2594478 RepID=A0A6I2MUB3_9FLAO|nr:MULTISPECIES: hypothetical protein [Maribacter]MDV7138644.1 hypothetical protein [Maribacter sp. TH_r10]MRX65984.1 hypothetical protein [Maribacter luteus]
MRLQELMVERIDNFIGIEKLTEELERMREMTHEKVWFDDMIICFNSLYLKDFNAEEYTLNYKIHLQKTIDFLNRFSKGTGSEIHKFLIDLLEFKIDYVYNLRKIS